MNKIYTLAALMTGFLAITSCNNEDLWGEDAPGARQGQLEVLLKNDATVKGTRADVEAGDNGEKLGVFDANEVDVQNYTLTITNAEGQILQNGKVSDLGGNNGSLTISDINEGTINVAAENYDGSAVNVSTRPWFRGTTSGNILAGKATQMEVNCKLQNIEVKIALAQSFLNKFKDDYSITVDNGTGAIQTYTKNNVSTKYYFAVPENRSSINVSVKATTRENDSFIQRSYTITKPANAEGNNILTKGDAFIINLKEDGSMLSYVGLGITVDFRFAEQEETFTIPGTNITYDENLGGGEEGGETNPDQPGEEAIVLTGLPASYTNPSANGQNVEVNINAKNGIQNLFVTITSNIPGFASTIEGLGLGGTFDLANPGDLEYVLTNSLDSGEGIGLMKPGEVIVGKTEYTFNVTDFMGLIPLYGAGIHTFTIEIVDNANNRKSGDLVVTITE